MAAPFLSYHAAMAGLANMAATISPTETGFLIWRLHMISMIERLTIDSGPVRDARHARARKSHLPAFAPFAAVLYFWDDSTLAGDVWCGADHLNASIGSVASKRFQNQQELLRKHGGLHWWLLCGAE